MLANGRINKSLIMLTTFLVIVNLPLFLKYIFPIHDTSLIHRIFYFFYNDLFFHGEIPQWLPFGFYGFQSSMLFMELSPASIITGAIGLLIRTEDTGLLFAIALLIEQFILLLGAYRLSGLLFRHEASRVFVCLAVICGTVLITQVEFNFRIFYLLPFIIYYMILFFRERRPSRLVTALLISLLCFNGIAAYTIIIPALTTSSIFLVLLIAHMKDWREFTGITRREAVLSLALFAVFVIMLVTYYAYLKSTMLNAALITPERNPDYSLTLETFLTYGGRIGLEKFEGLFYPSELQLFRTSAFENTLYIGLIALLFLAYALAVERGAIFLSFLSAVIVLGLLSLGRITFVAEAFYNWVPMMKFYRHIGLAVGNYKILLPLMAGFGFDRLMDRMQDKERWVVPVLLSLIAIEHVVLSSLIRVFLYLSFAWYVVIMTVIVFGSLAAGYYFLKRYGSRRLTYFILLCMMFETVMYQSTIVVKIRDIILDISTKSHVSTADIVSTMRTNEYRYQAQRTDKPEGARATTAGAYLDLGVKYNYDYNYLQREPCFPDMRGDVMSRGAIDFFRIRGGSARAGDDDLLAIGCNAPKLRVLEEAEYAETEGELVGKVTNSDRIGSRPVIYGVPETLRNASGAGEAEVLRYRPNEMTVKASTTGPAWLYYSDSWHPYWRAYINGSPAPLYISNMAFKAVRIPEGESVIVLRYENYGERIRQWMILLYAVSVTLYLMSHAIIPRNPPNT